MIIMFHVKQIGYILVFGILGNKAMSQGSISMSTNIITYQLPEDISLRKTISLSPGFKTLSKEEQDVAYYLDYARKNPSVFLERAINVFVAGHPEIHSSYIKSLQNLFASLTPLQLILPDTAISYVSRMHAMDLQTHNVITHTSTDGTSFKDRVSKVLRGCGSEAIHASPRFASLEAVLMLLFDFNVPDLGHRKSLLNANFTKAGFGVSLSSQSNSILVIDFSCQ